MFIAREIEIVLFPQYNNNKKIFLKIKAIIMKTDNIHCHKNKMHTNEKGINGGTEQKTISISTEKHLQTFCTQIFNM